MHDSIPSQLSRTEPLRLEILPPVFLITTHLPEEDVHEVEDQLTELGASLTYDAHEAKLFIGRIGTKRRAEFELRCQKLWTEEVSQIPDQLVGGRKSTAEAEPPRKRQRVDKNVDKRDLKASKVADEGSETESDPGMASTESETASETQSETASEGPLRSKVPEKQPLMPEKAPLDYLKDSPLIRVVRLDWLDDMIKKNKLLPIDEYLIYQGKTIPRPAPATSSPPPKQPFLHSAGRVQPASQRVLADRPQTILQRAKADATGHPTFAAKSSRNPFARHNLESTRDIHPSSSKRKAHLLQQTTSEYEDTIGSDQDIPPAPAWVKNQLRYACQRATPANPPNDPFISELKKIRLARTLTGDEIGVRAYSSSIAALAAYPYPLSSARELLTLPGCDVKIANLWIEWTNTRAVQEANLVESDEEVKILKLFYDVWGVGATTARDFYRKGWRELDDVIEYGWKSLSRVQQIGVKFYEEFLTPIPRKECEEIAAVIRRHAVRVRDEGIEVCIVGGYRRGNKEAGDVDVVVSHRRMEGTANLVKDIVDSLEEEGWITHTLLLSLAATERGQSTLPFRASGPASGTGFDTLDKALVVWQDPGWPSKTADLDRNPKAKNPNIHRRVDIIVSPWRTVGCAVCGWSGGNTFQRDLRRFAKHAKNWKFDSSGIRDRHSGAVLELEGPEGVDGSVQDAEKAVFKGLGLEYREPWERCTG
ncbi:terminal deoxynucleotidyl transferas-like protein [Aulographum hederae CBS 113979]|uniref:DNA-directed DNA polymerase n=1 Tax=Aulographum hederae CBS 113979 TaxID=1176131 RepID=A0A6G1GJT9_9PEZI|nr:terminal deoxynucleotidyl transferas-like protein [Aulographum hederae CBS 113979]